MDDTYIISVSKNCMVAIPIPYDIHDIAQCVLPSLKVLICSSTPYRYQATTSYRLQLSQNLWDMQSQISYYNCPEYRKALTYV